jgi:hypothetical protein
MPSPGSISFTRRDDNLRRSLKPHVGATQEESFSIS